MIPSSFSVKSTHCAKANKILSALPNEVFSRWEPMLEQVALPLGKVIYNTRDTMPFVYFPTSAVVSMICTTRDGQSIEVALIGNEGIVGVGSCICDQAARNQKIVQTAGIFYRLRSDFVAQEFQQNGQVRNLLLRYSQALVGQLKQNAVCNRLHKLDQQLCRWLLMCMDRTTGNDLFVTQDLLATILGVRRESVTGAAMRLRDAGLIRYARGHLQVLNRAGLEDRVCECYGVVNREYERLVESKSNLRTCSISFEQQSHECQV